MAQTNNFSNEPVTIVFNWRVKPGKEQEFERRMHEIHKVARTFPGHMGVTTLNSLAQKDNFHTILRFDTAQHLSDWLNSPARKEMMKPLEEIAHRDVSTKATGLETWFELPGQHVSPPPRWKMALTTMIAIYPLSLLTALYVTPYMEDWPVAIRALFLTIVAPLILTYLFMPFLTQRVLKRWLYKSDS